MLFTVLALASVAAVSAYLGWFLREKAGRDKIARADKYSEELLADARAEGENLKKERLLEAEEEIFQLRQRVNQEGKNQTEKLKELEKALSTRETSLDRKVDIISAREVELNQMEQTLGNRESTLKAKEQELDKLVSEQNNRLEMISGLTNEEAKRIQMENIMEEVRQEAAAMIKEVKDKARLTATSASKEIILQAIQRSAVSHVVESTVSIVELPNDDMKGRIIGREGRNIRTFETATGVEVLIDDTPEIVMLSGFDPIRREVAKLALEKLIFDGRIHPGRIEEVIEKSREEVNESFLETGENAMLEVGLHGLDRELLRHLGRLRYHTSKGQNLLQHSIEVATLAGLMASELDLDSGAARRVGLLHEIGAAAENQGPGNTIELSAELAKRYGESESIHTAILMAHGQDQAGDAVQPTAVLVAAANEISAARPGAQKEMLANYFKRLESLEKIANGFMGVTSSYAIQAGREIRVMVEYTDVDDAQAEQLAMSIANKIQNDLTYPGQIKVTVIREYRSVDFAR